MKDKYNVSLAMAKQAEFCKEKGHPHFAPSSGRCWKCKRNIYTPIGWKDECYKRIEVSLDSPELEYTTGVSVEKASKELITGCPHCNISYCD